MLMMIQGKIDATLGTEDNLLQLGIRGMKFNVLADLYDAGTLRPVLDRTFPFEDTPEARAYVEQGRAKGKIVVTMPPSGT